MSYRGTYEGNSLKHYRTKGSRNGYTKYPGKYTPIGEKAQYNLDNAVKTLGGKIFKKNSTVADTAPGLRVTNQSAAQLNQRTQNTAPGLKVATDVENLNQRTQNTAPGLNVARKSRVTSQSFPRTDKSIGRRNTDTNSNYTSAAQAASARVGQKAFRDRRTKEAAEYARASSFRNRAAASADAARNAEAKRQNLRTGESQVMANRRNPVSDARTIKGTANSARAAVENRRTAESKKAHYQRELEKSKKVSSARNSRSDVQNAVADAKSDAKRLIKKGRKKVRNLLRKFF